MISCTLGDKKYTVDYVTGRALREIEPALKMYAKIASVSEAAINGREIGNPEEINIPDAMDIMIRWFCLLFNNQFTPDDVLDHYPVDRLMHDIVVALIAVQAQTTDVLDAFPTTAAQTQTEEAPAD